MPKKKIEGPCKAEGCDQQAHTKGYCYKHYERQYRYGRLHKINEGNKYRHELYGAWWDRKRLPPGMCDDWLDFKTFIRDVGPKPDGNVMLVRLRKEEKWGPSNFKWLTHLKRMPNESRRAWYARKWKSRNDKYPTFDRARYIKKQYGITLDQRDKMEVAQNNLCAICQNPEIHRSDKTGTTKRLSIDHCHKTGLVRGLLCASCNHLIGQAKDDIEILRRAIAYLKKHERNKNANSPIPPAPNP